MPPAKKGGSQYGVVNLFFFPFKVAYRVVFYPVNLVMWLLVDMIGNDRPYKPLAKLIKRKFPFLEGWIKFLKEYRTVLIDHFAWQKGVSNPAKCKGGCGAYGDFWCIDCKKKLCTQCSYNLHAPGTAASKHSIEPIVKERREKIGVHIVTPILPELLILGLFIYLRLTETFITPSYLTHQVTCPCVSRTRSLVAGFDANLFYYFKSGLIMGCDLEDSFVRFICDGWVRSIVTDTDNTLLVLQTVFQALLFEVVLTYTLVPIAAMIYAFLSALVYKIEEFIPSNETTLKVEEFTTKYLDLSSILGIGEWSTKPPETKPRLREPMDLIDRLSYGWDFYVVRQFYAYYNMCLDNLQSFSWTLVMGTLSFRLACIWLRVGAIFRVVVWCCGFGGKIRLHRKWFGAASGMVVREDNLWTMGRVVLDMTNKVFVGLPTPIVRMGKYWAILAFLLICASAYGAYLIMMQRRQFDAKWKSGGQAAALSFGQKKTLQGDEKSKGD